LFIVACVFTVITIIPESFQKFWNIPVTYITDFKVN
jgi:hypothetical protein